MRCYPFVFLVAFVVLPFAIGGCPCPPKMVAPHARMQAPAPGVMLAYTIAP